MYKNAKFKTKEKIKYIEDVLEKLATEKKNVEIVVNLQEQIDFYKEHPEMLQIDFQQQNIYISMILLTKQVYELDIFKIYYSAINSLMKNMAEFFTEKKEQMEELFMNPEIKENIFKNVLDFIIESLKPQQQPDINSKDEDVKHLLEYAKMNTNNIYDEILVENKKYSAILWGLCVDCGLALWTEQVKPKAPTGIHPASSPLYRNPRHKSSSSSKL
jgi:hypothetical protein